MEYINGIGPEAVLRLSELDVDLVQALAVHWLVTVEENEDEEFIYELYPK